MGVSSPLALGGWLALLEAMVEREKEKESLEIGMEELRWSRAGPAATAEVSASLPAKTEPCFRSPLRAFGNCLPLWLNALAPLER